MINRQIRLARPPEFVPEVEHFALAEAAVGLLGGDQVLVANQFLSLDPYMRSQISGTHITAHIKPGDVMQGETVGQIVRSNSAKFAAGDWVTCFGNWQEYAVLDATHVKRIDERISTRSHALSSLGMPGLTAYAGLMWMAKLVVGDVVLVPAATGAVGSMVGQLARVAGCKVVGIAGSDEKCRVAVEQLGYDACFNRKEGELAEQLKEHCPDGVDIYFDLVGGETLNTVCLQLALNARIILCGIMSDLNKPTRTPGPMLGPLISKRATMMGLVVYDWENRRSDFVEAVQPLIESGQVVVREDIAEGIERTPLAFCRLMRGETHGKAIVHIGASVEV